MSRTPIRPFLVEKNEDGKFRLTLRRTRYNSQNYPIVVAEVQEEVFPTLAAAKAHARDKFGALAGQYATA